MAAPEERVARAFEERATRAEQLDSAPAREPLRFAAGLFRVQARLVLVSVDGPQALAAAAAPLLEYAAARGPQELSADAREALRGGFAGRLAAYGDGGPFDYLARAALSPWLRLRRERGEPGEKLVKGVEGEACASCGGAPWMASRREAAASDGAARFLHCALCGAGWQVGRILCPACGEGSPGKLPSFGAPEHPGVRIEACETCRSYVKSIDLSVDARRIPEVDDLLSLALDLWAAEQGFARIEPGLAGI